MKALALAFLLLAAVTWASSEGLVGGGNSDTQGVVAPRTDQPVCQEALLGREIMYRKGSGATEITSRCICEQIAGPSYVWNPATSTGDCT